MIIKSHLCGIAVAFDRYEASEEQKQFEKDLKANESKLFFNSTYTNDSRPQGSLYSWQKRKIADACEYMRLNSTYKPLIFVATSPGFTDLASERQLISKLTHNLRNGYGAKNYVWVREFTGNGFPHFHFVCDMPECDMVSISLYWSSLFNSSATNSIRFGTAPKCSKCSTKLKAKGQQCYKCKEGFGRVDYYLKGKKMSWYMTKYLAKSIGESEKGALKGKRSFRTFAVSQELSKLSAPVEFKAITKTTGYKQTIKADGKYYPFPITERVWQNCTSCMTEDFVKKKWNWQYTGFANTHKGFPKEWKLRKKVEPKPEPEFVCPF